MGSKQYCSFFWSYVFWHFWFQGNFFNPLVVVIWIQSTDSAQLKVLGCPVFGWLLSLNLTFLSPARSFGPALVSGSWQDHWLYWAGPFLGSIFAALLHKVTHLIRFGIHANPTFSSYDLWMSDLKLEFLKL